MNCHFKEFAVCIVGIFHSDEKMPVIFRLPVNFELHIVPFKRLICCQSNMVVLVLVLWREETWYKNSLLVSVMGDNFVSVCVEAFC